MKDYAWKHATHKTEWLEMLAIAALGLFFGCLIIAGMGA